MITLEAKYEYPSIVLMKAIADVILLIHIRNCHLTYASIGNYAFYEDLRACDQIPIMTSMPSNVHAINISSSLLINLSYALYAY